MKKMIVGVATIVLAAVNVSFVFDKDLYVKLLFITDKTSPELTADYLKIIKERYLEN